MMKAFVKRGLRFSGVAASSVVLAVLSGCASLEFTKPAPAQTQAVVVKISNEEISAWNDLPLGAYKVPQSQVVITGHQKGTGVGLLFGVVGLAIAHAANANSGAASVQDLESRLRVNLNARVDETLAQLGQPDQFGKHITREERPGAPRMLLTPAVIMSYVSDTDVRPYVLIKAELMGNEIRPLWTTRYIASTGAARPLAGPGGWLDGDASAFNEVLRTNVGVALRAMATDLARPAPRDETKMTMVQGAFPFVKTRFQTVGYQLAEDDRYLTFIPRLGDILVFAGVNIMDKTVTTFRPSTKEDPIFKLLDEPKKAE